MTTYINVDLDKYIVYENLNTDGLVAVDIALQDKMIELYRKYNKFKTAPDSEVVEAYVLQFDKKSNCFYLNENVKETIKISQLKGTIIRIMTN
jgi:hypothetical protein